MYFDGEEVQSDIVCSAYEDSPTLREVLHELDRESGETWDDWVKARESDPEWLNFAGRYHSGGRSKKQHVREHCEQYGSPRLHQRGTRRQADHA